MINRRTILTAIAGLASAAVVAPPAIALEVAKPAGRLTLEDALADPTAPGQPAADYVYRMRAYRRGGRTGGFWRSAVLRARRRRGR